MDSNTLNTYLGLVGLIILLVGLIFVGIDNEKYQMYILPLTGVGASILSTAAVNAILNIKIKDILIQSVITALQDKTRFIRHDHNLELRLYREGDEIKVVGRHEFTLLNNSRFFKATKKMMIYTDVANLNQTRGGFESVEEPDGTRLAGEELENKIVHEKKEKTYFMKDYTILPNSKARFEFTTIGYYRLADRMIWTVQDLSADFRIRILNFSKVRGCMRIKINHHKEDEIMKEIMKQIDNPRYWHDGEKIEEIKFEFNSEILPYQGFELLWNFEDPIPCAR
jgi:hypothetical protein